MSSTPKADWGSDTSPSAPKATTRPRLVSFGGFCFTDAGITIDISEAEAEEFRHPPFAPYTDVHQ